MPRQAIRVDDKAEIERFVRRDPALHLYELGDLDPFFWPHTTWLGLRDERGELSALALLYTGTTLPTLLALGGPDGGARRDLVDAMLERLPSPIYAHLSPGLLGRFGSAWSAEPHGRHLKMVHRHRARLDDVDTEQVQPLHGEQLDEIQAFYARAYPGNWFDARMLQTGHYVGLWQAGSLVSVAGVHVFSPRYGVAALGNITTAPECRGRGLARRVTAALCRGLYREVELIGLNVKADNVSAIACYERLGFATIGEYDEVALTRRPASA
ncbi:MAG: GNAT family N-acetyltransferase [Myxococcota bacterium]